MRSHRSCTRARNIFALTCGMLQAFCKTDAHHVYGIFAEHALEVRAPEAERPAQKAYCVLNA